MGLWRAGRSAGRRSTGRCGSRRVGPDQAARLTQACLPVSPAAALRCGLIDQVIDADPASYPAHVAAQAEQLARSPGHAAEPIQAGWMPGYTRAALPPSTAATMSSGSPSAATARAFLVMPGTPGQSLPKIHLAASRGRSKPA
jgi:enoyl-CoA hydratase/carnithine racemase